MSPLVLSLVLVTFAYAAPPFVPPLNLSPCVDGVNNVVQLADVNDANLVIHAKDVVIQTYDANGNPSCNSGQAAVSLPGQLKLAKGTIIVNPTNADVKKAELDFTLKKNSIFIGTVCQDGIAKKSQVPKDDCHFALDDNLIQMFSIPGTYDLEKFEEEALHSNIIKLPAISSTLNNLILKGGWKAEVELVAGGQKIGHLKAPSNTEWLYIN